ncbi:hypothetical protein ACFLRB_04095 [Acidobacteriota bacterium]
MRTITFNSEIQNGTIKLPDEYKSLEKNKIEVILIVKDPLKNDAKRSKEGKKAKGMLSKYSNIELIKKEKSAWEIAVKEKHAHR